MRIFVTRTGVSADFMLEADFVGLSVMEGVDKICQDAADAADAPEEDDGLGQATFMAWFSTTDGGSPSTRFTQSTGDYVRTDGAVVASGWDDLTSGFDETFFTDEFGVEMSVKTDDFSSNTVPTNTQISGAPYNSALGRTCGDFTVTSGSSTPWGKIMHSSFTNLYPQGLTSCDRPIRFICVEQ